MAIKMMKQMKEKHTCQVEAKQDLDTDSALDCEKSIVETQDDQTKCTLVDDEKNLIEDLESSQLQALEKSEPEFFEDKAMKNFELHDHPDEHCSRNRICKDCR